jgi:hypothetical protein
MVNLFAEPANIKLPRFVPCAAVLFFRMRETRECIDSRKGVWMDVFGELTDAAKEWKSCTGDPAEGLFCCGDDDVDAFRGGDRADSTAGSGEVNGRIDNILLGSSKMVDLRIMRGLGPFCVTVP